MLDGYVTLILSLHGLIIIHFHQKTWWRWDIIWSKKLHKINYFHYNLIKILVMIFIVVVGNFAICVLTGEVVYQVQIPCWRIFYTGISFGLLRIGLDRSTGSIKLLKCGSFGRESVVVLVIVYRAQRLIFVRNLN